MEQLPTDPRWHGEWTLEPADARVGFRARGFWGAGSVAGRFDEVSGALRIGPDDISVGLQVQAASVATGIGIRDRHLRGGQFLHASAHSLIRFESSRAAVTQEGIDVAGTLTVRGTSIPVEVPLAVREDGADLVASGTCTVDVRDFGMELALGMVRPQAELFVEARLVREPSDAL